MEMDKLADMLADMVADMEVNMVATITKEFFQAKALAIHNFFKPKHCEFIQTLEDSLHIVA